MSPLAVRELAAFAGRSGDLGGGHFSLLRGVEGTRAHQRLQKDRGPDFQAEVPIRARWSGPEGELELQGRIDGVERCAHGVVIEEIKTTRVPEGDTPLDFAAHRLQVLLYAWMWWENTGTCPCVRLRYVAPDAGEGWTVEPELSAEALSREVDAACAAWLRHARDQLAWRRTRDTTLRDLPFPFTDTRPGQEALMQAVAQRFTSGGRLYAEAPTGIGKTHAVLVPALRALGRGEMQRLFIATCRNTGKTVFEEAFRSLVDRDAKIRALTLVAKDRCCRNTGTPCDTTACPLAKGFFDRLHPALAELREEPHWDTDTWSRIADAHRLCPFAFLMQAAREADVLIGDLNYALDPAARLSCLFDPAPEDVALLIDEAHHLPERARQMHSATLDLGELGQILRTLPPALRGMSPFLARVRRAARSLELREQDRVRLTEAPPREVAEACRRAAEALDISFGACPRLPDDPRPELIPVLRGFSLNVERHSAAHLTYRDGRVLHHFCRDPAEQIGEVLDALHAVVLFSATLRPMAAFRRLAGSTPLDRELILPSPFDPAQFPVEVEESIPMVWRSRGPKTYDRLAARIRRFLEARPGKSLVFLPSFEVQEELRRRLPEHDLWFGPVLSQPRGLQEAASVEFLRPFREQRGPITGLAVLGGSLNEGIDLPGEALTTVVVVGIGLPAVTPRRELLRQYHQERGEDGFVLAYTVPGLLRVLQAMGRVIRGPEDVGRALLIDPRFTHPFYQEHLPRG